MSNTAQFAEVFLDYAAGTPISSGALAAMLPYFDAQYRNPSSMHKGGRRAREAIENARTRIAYAIGASPEEIIFTSSGTESDNLALTGIARIYQPQGDHIIISGIEHKAVLETARALEKEGIRVTILPVDRHGMIDIEDLLSHITGRTILVSIIYANNELGTIQPLKDIVRAVAYTRGATGFPLIHTDACQAFSYLEVDVEALGIDLMTFNSAKLYGPTGVAALYKRKSVRLTPRISGGEQEWQLRAGTEPTPLIVGFAHAVEEARTQSTVEVARLLPLRQYFVEELHKAIPDIIINGHPTDVLSNIVHVTVPDIEGEAMLLLLDETGVSVSTGSACSAFDLRPSHVLTAIGQKSDLIHGSIRFSFGRDTTKEKLDYALAAFSRTVEQLKGISAVTTHAYELNNR